MAKKGGQNQFFRYNFADLNSNFFNSYLVIERNYFHRIFREIASTSMIFLVTLFQNDLIIFEFFEYHLECRIEIAIIWDISELSIQFIGEIIAKKRGYVFSRFLRPYLWTSTIIILALINIFAFIQIFGRDLGNVHVLIMLGNPVVNPFGNHVTYHVNNPVNNPIHKPVNNPKDKH